jgi:hypothetical protein
LKTRYYYRGIGPVSYKFMQSTVSYELHTLESGVWKILHVFQDKQEALIKARRIEEGVRPRETRVIEEQFDGSSGKTRNKIVYTTPEIRDLDPKASRQRQASKSKRNAPLPSPKRPTSEKLTGSLRVGRGRARPLSRQANSSRPWRVMSAFCADSAAGCGPTCP